MSNPFDALREDTPSTTDGDVPMHDDERTDEQQEQQTGDAGSSHKRPHSPSAAPEGNSHKRHQRDAPEAAGFSQTRSPNPMSRSSSPGAAPPPQPRTYAQAAHAARELESPDPYVSEAPRLKPRGAQMPIPLDGFPEPDGVSKAGLLRPVSERLRVAWGKIKTNTLAAWYVRPYNTPIETAQARVQVFLNKTFPEGTNAIAALSEGDPSRPGERSILIIITRLTNREHALLLSRPLWSTDDATFFVRDWTEELDNFSHTKTGLTLQPTAASAEELRSLFVPLVRDNQAVRDFVGLHNDAIPSEVCESLDEAVDWIAAGIYFVYLCMVRAGAPGVPRTDWNVYVPSPTNDLDLNTEWRQLISSIDIETDFFGVGRHLDISWSCSTCMSVSHPTGMCPFPRLPGWKGPAASPLPAIITPPTTTAAAHISVAGLGSSSCRDATPRPHAQPKAKGKATSRR